MRHDKPKYRLLYYLLVLLNFVAAFVYLLAFVAGWIPPLMTSFFSVFALIFPPLFLANITFVVIWAFWRKRMIFLSLILLILSTGTIVDNFQVSTAKKGDPGNQIKILTYNVQRFGMDVDEETFTENKNNIVQFMKEENVDIVCMQEFHGKGKTLYEPLQKLKGQLGADDYYYESYFNPRFNQLTGLVTFSKFDAINKGKLKFEGSRTFGIYTDLVTNNDTVRVFNIHLASIQLMHSDIDFVVNPGQDKEVFSLHLLKIYSKLSEAFELREHQMDYLIHEISRSPYPVILAGDFNDTPSSYIYNRISSKLDDTFVEKGNGFGITYAGRLPFLRIDYIFKDEQFKTLYYNRFKIDFSDHYPVSVSLAYQE